MNGLFLIHPLTLVPGYLAGSNVYIWNEAQGSKVRLLSSDQMVTDSIFHFLLSNPGQQVFVHDTSYGSYKNYLFENMETWLGAASVPRILKTTIIAEFAHSRITEAIAKNSIPSLIEVSIECGNKISRFYSSLNVCGDELRKLLRHDSSFTTHAVNVAIYSFLIANSLGYSSECTAEICAGAILHDIGKLNIGTRAGSPGFIEDASSDWIGRNTKTHPSEGFRRMCRESGITQTHLFMCYQHHERPDGNGFPVGLHEGEIAEASLVCAVANRFDGLTSNRTHRAALTQSAAIRVIETEKSKAFDSELVRCLVQRLSRPSAN